MQNQTIEFSTGNLIINDSSLSFHNKSKGLNEVLTISRENIGHVDQEPLKILPNAEMIHCFQMAVIGFVMLMVGLVIGISSDNYMVFYFGITIVFFAGFLLFSYIWLDSMLGLKIAKPILYSIYGVDALRVVVQNVFGGNNLVFLIRKDEIEKLPELEEYKKTKVYEVVNEKRTDDQNKGFDDIEKLSELKDKGIITQEEFDLKKKQILGL